MKKNLLSRILTFILICSMVLPLAACGGSSEGTETEQNTLNDAVQAVPLMGDYGSMVIDQEYDPEPAQAEITDFAVRLFQNSVETDKNTLISPISVLVALSMTANGAKGNTLSEMDEVLGLDTDQRNAYLRNYMLQLPQGEKYKLQLANSIWFTSDERFTVKEDFLQKNAEYYEADIYKAPFDDTTLKDINLWVEEKTDGMIKDILDKIPQEAVMYLINALVFEAEWAATYEQGQVREGIFTTEEGQKQTVELMYSDEFCYLEDDNATGFIKHYNGQKYAFVALLPNEGVSVEEYVKSLSGSHINALLTSPKNTHVNAAMPVFETEYDVLMNDVLAQMGMAAAFEGETADFTGLGTSIDGNIHISRVIHKTYITVGPQGTKAGAATVVEMKDESAPFYEESKTVYLDRPFVYMLIDCENNQPFFIGTLMKVEDAQ